MTTLDGKVQNGIAVVPDRVPGRSFMVSMAKKYPKATGIVTTAALMLGMGAAALTVPFGATYVAANSGKGHHQYSLAGVARMDIGLNPSAAQGPTVPSEVWTAGPAKDGVVVTRQKPIPAASYYYTGFKPKN